MDPITYSRDVHLSPVMNPSNVELSLFSGDLIETPDTFMLDKEPSPLPLQTSNITRQLFLEEDYDTSGGDVPPDSIMPFEEPDNDNDTRNNNNIIIVKCGQKTNSLGIF
jgi:hypothetical protein